MFKTTSTLTFVRSRLGGLAAVAMAAAIGGMTASTSAGVVPDSLISYWNFNDEPTGGIVDGLFQANVGSGQMFSPDSSQDIVGNGTTDNALFDESPGNALRVFNNPIRNIDFQFSMADRQDLAMTFALRPQFSSFIGIYTYDNHVWSWSTDGVNFTDALEYEITEFSEFNSQWQTHELDFSSVTELNGAEEVTLRLILSGGSGWYTSFDNIQIHGNIIPAPGVLALLGFAGLCGTRRRRTS